jgi:phage FluMu protein gp41
MRIIARLFAVCILASAAFGQGATGTITGTVTDPSGAIIANANVEVTSATTAQVYTAVSTNTGNYTIVQLPVGAYNLKVSVSGFKSYERRGLDLAATQTMRIDVPLEVGSVGDSVTVTAEASLLNTENASIARNVTIQQLTQLPILAPGGAGNANTAGYRDPYALAALLPGVQFTGNGRIVVNGAPDDTVQFRLEGQTSNAIGGLRQYTTMGQPSADAIQEVAVQSSTYAPEFGAVGGAVFNATMKSGGNGYHGSAYDYVANEILNAYTPYTHVRNPTKRHSYGFTFGGPIRIPGVYNGTNKTFFFGSYEGFFEDVKVNPAATTVPTAAYRAGNFATVISGNGNAQGPLNVLVGGTNYLDPLGRVTQSGTLFDQLSERPINGIQTRDPFVNNVIPVSRFDPVAVKVIGLVPMPVGGNHDRGSLGNNYQNPWLSKTRSYLPSLKLDHSVGTKMKLSGLFNETHQEVQYSTPNGNMEGFPTPITAARGSFIYTFTYRANMDYTLTPTMLLHVGAGWYHLNFNDPSPTLDFDAEKELGLKGSTLNRHFPVINVGSAGVGTGGMNNLGPSGAIQGSTYERRPSGVANITWVKGNHTYKYGGEWRLERYPVRNFGASSGLYTFGSNSTQQTSLQGLTVSQGVTGFPFASFLMGDLTSVQITRPATSATHKTQIAFFAQDTWKVTRKFTLDYGLRYDFGQYAREDFGRTGSFNPLLANPAAAGHPGGYQFEATCNCQFAKNYKPAFGPRLGVAYQLNEKTVLRGGFGIVYTATALPPAGGIVANNAFTSVPGFGQTVGKFKDGIPTSLNPVFPDFRPDVTQLPGTIVNATYLDPNAGRPARQYQWSMGFQRELTRDMVIDASYIGNRGVWWNTAGTAAPGLNMITPELLGRYGFTIGNTADSTLLTRQIGQLNTQQLGQLAQRGVSLPYSNFPTNQTVRQSILPFPQYGNTITPTAAPVGKTWYDSLQINVTQRFWHGLSMNANYTYSKNLDHLTSPDVFNWGLGKGYSANDQPHQFRYSAQYQLPELRNSTHAMLRNPVVAWAFSGWGIGLLLQYQSADRLNRPNSAGTFPISNYLGRGPGGNNGAAQIRTNPDGSPMNPWSVNWTDYDGVKHTDPLDVNCHCFDPTKTQVLNPAAWTNIPDGQWANDFSAIRSFRGLRYPNEAANISRNFRIREGISLNIRVEFQNAFNRTRLPQVTSAANFAAAPTTLNGLFNGGFGTIVPLTGAPGARSGLFIGRLTF